MKKWNVEDNIPLSRKDIIHCIRELLFGIELAQTGRITRFDAANALYEEMKAETSMDWEYYKKKYKPIYNKLSTQLRAVAPKDQAKPRREHLLNPTSPEDVERVRERVKQKWERLLEYVAAEKGGTKG